ncbi:hypothetical protein JW711_01035 [Candidatus Woesearchaeota archaeon]|nr:hypothetical protein [Candidatus Woesearchaeota archaeon]
MRRREGATHMIKRDWSNELFKLYDGSVGDFSVYYRDCAIQRMRDWPNEKIVQYANALKRYAHREKDEPERLDRAVKIVREKWHYPAYNEGLEIIAQIEFGRKFSGTTQLVQETNLLIEAYLADDRG